MLLPFKSVTWSLDHGNHLNIQAPWIELDVEIKPENRVWVIKGISDLERNPTTPESQELLAQLKAYRLGYHAPRALKESDVHPSLFKEEALQAWPLEEVFSACRCPTADDFYDPISVATYLEGFRLEGEAASDAKRCDLPKLLETLKKQNEEKFFEMMALLYRQTYEITKAIQELLPIAIKTFPEISSPLKQFLEEEKGHDALMSHSLKHLGYENPSDLPLLKSAEAIIHCFRNLCKISPLAIALAVGFFEGSFYQDVDDLAECLKTSSKPKAALGYQRHFEINREGHHTEMIYDLVSALPAQSREAVQYAAACLEKLTLYGQNADLEIVEKIKEALNE